jgi:hypothetical protein
VLGVVLALFPSIGLAGGMAPPSHRERSQARLLEGDEAVERGDLGDAIMSYRAAYYGLSTRDQASYLGSITIRKAMLAFEQSIAQERDRRKRRQLIRDQRFLLTQFLDAVAARAGAAEEIGVDLIAELEHTRDELDQALDARQDLLDPFSGKAPRKIEPTRAGVAPASTNTSTPTTTDAPKPPRDWLGLGLTIGGSAVLATGLGVSVGWWTVRSLAPARADDEGEAYAEGTEARKAYLASEDAYARKFLIAGSVLAGIGVATALGGVAHLVLHRRDAANSTAMHIVPLLGPGSTGVALQRRF